jgi:hypothetical protein
MIEHRTWVRQAQATRDEQMLALVVLRGSGGRGMRQLHAAARQSGIFDSSESFWRLRRGRLIEEHPNFPGWVKATKLAGQ